MSLLFSATTRERMWNHGDDILLDLCLRNSTSIPQTKSFSLLRHLERIGVYAIIMTILQVFRENFEAPNLARHFSFPAYNKVHGLKLAQGYLSGPEENTKKSSPALEFPVPFSTTAKFITLFSLRRRELPAFWKSLMGVNKGGISWCPPIDSSQLRWTLKVPKATSTKWANGAGRPSRGHRRSFWKKSGKHLGLIGQYRKWDVFTQSINFADNNDR